ncbi:GNAT family N-acetyltransferase [Xaviernesmea oryzae]|uniref:GNAT family N-acetyltransferase n=1 Tax=Xaviernesmea oryzae TaxID=464029 RepID=A0A1Q9AUK0_9HYPH|nr:GNAT family N-acetyltransferase [Xaviernesmea oryzae]OLP59130.1 GNAT family N-acetyltransferase [Xaviernesmea oryzae]SEK85316.1 Acetyltransferase (GNAT) domain-containing protein [Xaviernesmea oryzae]
MENVQQAEIRIDPFPPSDDLNALWQAAWGDDKPHDFARILSRSLLHVGAYADKRLIGFVNVATDGGKHAFLLDTCVHPAMQRQGIATAMVKAAIQGSAERGAEWIHVDFEPRLERFYRSCGFAPTAAGLMRLR